MRRPPIRDAASLLLVAAGLAATPGPAEAQGPVITEAPNMCAALSPDAATELLEADAGEGMRADVAGWPCVYETEVGQRLTVTAHLGRGPELEGTQPAIELEYCAAEVVREIEDLGVGATLFRSTNPDCGGGHTLWVATDIRFEGEVQAARRTGQIHLVLSLEPEEDAERRIEVLVGAARRAIESLRAPD